MLKNVSLHHLTLMHATTPELIEAAAKAGFGYCGIRLIAPRAGDPVDNIDRLWLDRRQLLDIIERVGIKVLDVDTVLITPLTEVPDLARHIELAALLGAKFLLVAGGDADYERFLGNLAALARLAAEYGMTCALEAVPYTYVRSIGDCRKVIFDLAIDNIVPLVDSLHLHRSGWTVDMLTAEEFEAMPYVQLCDGPYEMPNEPKARRIESRQQRLLPGEGEFPLWPLVEKFHPKKLISIEAPNPRFQAMSIDGAAKIIANTVADFLRRADRASDVSALTPAGLQDDRASEPLSASNPRTG